MKFNGVLLKKHDRPNDEKPNFLGTANIKGISCRIGGWIRPGGSLLLKFQTDAEYQEVVRKLQDEQADQ